MDDKHPPKHYLVARIREALATDPRVNDLNIDVQLAGERIVLSGHVATKERSDQITAVVKELLPQYQLHNQTTVGGFGGSSEEEVIT